MDASGATVDEVAWSDLPPWPVRPGTDGASLERLDPLAPATVENWRSSTVALPSPLVGTGSPAATGSAEGPVPPFISALTEDPVVPEPGATVRITATVTGFPEIFHVAFGLTKPARNYRDLMAMDKPRYVRFTTVLLRRGVRALERGAWFMSLAHDEGVIDETLAAVREAGREVAR